ncbi:MAG: hypothetical protein ACRC11_08110 [Xenococcaceae cyanobacterium]
MKLPPNWKTSASGILVAFSGYVTFDPDRFGGHDAFLVKLCTFITLGGMASLGIFAKDASKERKLY